MGLASVERVRVSGREGRASAEPGARNGWLRLPAALGSPAGAGRQQESPVAATTGADPVGDRMRA